MTREKPLIVLTSLLAAIMLVSALHPFDRSTWLMEVAPIFIAVPILAFTYRRFPLSSLLYGLIFVHAVILIVGGMYSYARVPFGFWLQDLFALSRNPYDKIGHFAQGFVPALVAREILLRNGFVIGKKIAGFLSLCVAMAISAWYELIEWAAALALGQGADEFLGTQGDPWDTQSDMFFALIGATVAIVLFAAIQDRFIAKLNRGSA
jgi:putative membrane protein